VLLLAEAGRDARQQCAFPRGWAEEPSLGAGCDSGNGQSWAGSCPPRRPWLSSAGGAGTSARCRGSWCPVPLLPAAHPPGPCMRHGVGKNQWMKEVLIPGLASQDRNEFKTQQEVRKTLLSSGLVK